MLKKLDFSKGIPHFVAIIAFLIISYGYFTPLLEGKRLDQHDLKTFQGGAKEIADFKEATGEQTLWTNSMFGGMPSYLISTNYKGNLIKHMNTVLQIGPRPGSYLFLLLLGAYVLFIALRINPWISMIGAVAVAFSSYNFIIILAGHNTKVVAIAYVAPVLAGIFLTFRGKRLLGAALTGVFLSLQILAGHPQITYYTIFIVLFFGLSEFYFSIREKKLKEMFISLGLLVVVAIFSALSNYSRLATTLEYDDYSMRTKSELSQNEEDKTEGLNLSYATNWSYGIDETMTLLIPGFKGGSSTYELSENSNTFEALARLDRNFASQFIRNANMYWGDQVSTSGPVYLGAIIVFLFVLGLFIVEARYKWWILGVTVLAIMLSWGKNFMGLTEFFMHNIPGYNKFRTVSMTLVIPQIVVPILAVIALDKIFFGKLEKEKLLKGLKWSAGITGGLALLFLVIPSMAGNFSSPNDVRTIQAISGNNPQVQQMLMSSLPSALEADREAMLRTDSFRSLVFILLAAGLIYLYKVRQKKLNIKLVIGILGLLILVDMWSVNKRFLDDDNFESKQRHTQPYTATAADQAIFQVEGLNERVLNLTTSTFQDARTSYFHQSLGGYHGAKMRRYQDLIDTRLVDEMTMLIGGLQQQDFGLIDSVLSDLNIINMLNTRFIIINPEGAPLTNRYAMGNSWFVEEVIPAENADQELELVSSIDLSSIAVTDQKFLDQLENTSFQGNTSDRIELVDYLPNKLTYTSSAASERFAVFSEIFYDKGWKVTVDGEPADHIRANYLLRGMTVPAGEHTIVFEFRPRSYYTGERISLAGSLVLLLMLAGAIIMEFRRKGEDQ